MPVQGGGTTTAAGFTDVETALGRPIPEGIAREQVQWWLTGVEMAIRARLGDLTALNYEALVYVEAEAVAGKIRRHGNTETSITVSVDDGSVTRRYDTPATAADITDEWWTLLQARADAVAFTIRPAGGCDAPRGAW